MLEQRIQLEFPFTKIGASQQYAIAHNNFIDRVYSIFTSSHGKISKNDFYSLDIFKDCAKDFRTKYHVAFFSDIIE